MNAEPTEPMTPAEVTETDVTPRGPRTNLRVVIAGLAALAVAVSAGAYALFFRGATAVPPRDALLSAANLASSQSLRINATINETLTFSGPAASQFAALDGKSFALTLRMDVQSARRSSATVGASIAGQTLRVRAVQYDGSFYISTDDGATYQTLPINGQWSARYGPDSALQYLKAIGTVTDKGAGTADGVSVERYHADLDGAKITQAVTSALSALKSPLLDKVLRAIHYVGGSLDASLDSGGHVVTEEGSFDAAIDFGGLDQRLSGTTMNIHATVDGHFSDYGAAITVNRPSNVTGPANVA